MAERSLTLVVVPTEALPPPAAWERQPDAGRILSSALDRRLHDVRTEWTALAGSNDPLVLNALSSLLARAPAGTDGLLLVSDTAIPSLPRAQVSVDDFIGACHHISATCLFRTDAWRRLGGFPSATGSWCIRDFQLRMIRAGFSVHLAEWTEHNLALASPAVPIASDLDGARGFWTMARADGRTDASRAIAGIDHRLWQVRSDPLGVRRRREAIAGELASTAAAVAGLTAELAERGVLALEWGDFDRREPFSDLWGADRGQCIDRVYIEAFLERHAGDIRGRVLEVHDANYTRAFGTAVRQGEVLDVDPSNPRATMVADLRRLTGVPDGSFDCIILTQTLHLILELDAALASVRRVLAPDGVLLLTLPCAGRMAPEEGRNDFWRFTRESAAILLARAFPSANISVEAHGNLPATLAYLYGLAVSEAQEVVSLPDDPAYPLLITARVCLHPQACGA